MKGKVPVKDIISRVKMDLGVSNTRMDAKIQQYIIDCIVDLNLFINNEVNVVELDVNTNNNTVDLPDGFIKYRKIAVVSNGKLCVLRLDNDLAYRQNGDKRWCDDTDTDSGILAETNRPGVWYGYSRSGQWVEEEYSSNAVNSRIPSFRINTETNRIEISSIAQLSKVVLEYVGLADSITLKTRVSRQFIPVIRAYVHWNLLEFRDDVGANQKQRKKEIYEEEYKKAQFFTNMFTLTDFYDAIISTDTSGVKG